MRKLTWNGGFDAFLTFYCSRGRTVINYKRKGFSERNHVCRYASDLNIFFVASEMIPTSQTIRQFTKNQLSCLYWLIFSTVPHGFEDCVREVKVRKWEGKRRKIQGARYDMMPREQRVWRGGLVADVPLVRHA